MDIGRITFSIPPRTIAFNLNVNDVLPSVPLGKSAEEMLKKAFAPQQTPKPSVISGSPSWSYDIGRAVAYQDMAAHLEMLIKEAKNA